MADRLEWSPMDPTSWYSQLLHNLFLGVGGTGD